MAVLALPLAVAAATGVTSATLAGMVILTAASAVGAFIDMAITSSLMGSGSPIEGPRLDNARITTSIEGEAIPRVFGRVRIAGQLFWATRFKEIKTDQEVGGKGGGGQEVSNYSYLCSFAVAICQGPITRIGNIWADGKLMDLKDRTIRYYYGTEDQDRDPKIQAVEGIDATSAHRGIAYVVFENMPLDAWGNRIPQLNFEVFCPVGEDQLEDLIQGVNIIPGSTEYGYSPTLVNTVQVPNGVNPGLFGWPPVAPSTFTGKATQKVENQANSQGVADWVVSMDDLETNLPNCGKAQLVVTWFGSDLRLQNCIVEPKVESIDKVTISTSKVVTKSSDDEWYASDTVRANAQVVSHDGSIPLVGGTPSDRSVYYALQDLNSRGFKVSFYPFIFMDIPSGNALPNPYSNSAAMIGQPAFPWRGRIVPSPAPSYTGSPDKTAAVATHVATFFGTVAVSDFGTWNGLTIPYDGPSEWSYRRFILHYAKLCAAAGGVDMFYIGTEMVNLTQCRSGAATYPAVTALKTLAAEVAAILPSAQISYAADWTEWFNHRPSDGTNDVFFHLDPLWSDANIDAISIDNYLPLADWRDTRTHLDALIYPDPYSLDYLQSNIEGGELYDWYYASYADRVSQTRIAIADTGYGKDWVFRYKDLRAWWLNQHYNRPAGVESGSPTAWTPQSKPIIFSEIGCPAIDKGFNQPNVFYDPKSSESFFPYFSSGARDDAAQRAYLQAWYTYWDPAQGNNPISSVYSDYMLPVEEICVWTWDARPYPEFPSRVDLWTDGLNYALGHWINGRIGHAGQVTLAAVVSNLCQDLGVAVDTSTLVGSVTGYSIEGTISPRDAIGPLAMLYLFDSYESDGQIKFRMRGGQVDWEIDESDLVPMEDNANKYTMSRVQDLELPSQSIVKYIKDDGTYSQGVVQSKRLQGYSGRVADSTLAVVTSRERVQAASDIILIDTWVSREKLSVKLPPNMLAVNPTDIITLILDNGTAYTYRVEDIDYMYDRPTQLVRTDLDLYSKAATPTSSEYIQSLKGTARPVMDFVEIPLRKDAEAPGGPFFAIYAEPWQNTAIYRSIGESAYKLDNTVRVPTAVGTSILNNLLFGPEDYWDMGNELIVQMYDEDDTFQSLTEDQVLAGANIGAIKADNGEWEVIQWVTAELLSAGQYKLTRLLRGRLGTEQAMYAGATAGAQFVLLDRLEQSTCGVAFLNVELSWKIGPLIRPVDDPSYVTGEYAPLVTGLRPYSPVHLRATKEADNDWALTWIRRTRLPEAGDTWETGDAPLAEDTEKYEIDLYNAAGDTIVRTVTATTQGMTYTAAQQVADFGSSQSFVDFEVFQISATYGRGTGRRIRIDV